MRRRAPAERTDRPPLDLLFPPAPGPDADPREVLRSKPNLDVLVRFRRQREERGLAVAVWCADHGWPPEDFVAYRWSLEARERLRAEAVEAPGSPLGNW